ncbi:MAG: hypothetical protein Q4D13_02895 [Erysipelotrichaceae bacterium]|nr:hypothetical protein [Erysipelotrichaceae bacterium]
MKDIEVTNRDDMLSETKSPSSLKEDAFSALMGCLDSEENYEDILLRKVDEL